jgi:hypothetical protein
MARRDCKRLSNLSVADGLDQRCDRVSRDVSWIRLPVSRDHPHASEPHDMFPLAQTWFSEA